MSNQEFRRSYLRRSLEISEPGKIMNLIINLTDDTCSHLQMKINAYLEEECKADEVFQIIVNTERMEAYIDAVSEIPLTKKYKIKDFVIFLCVFDRHTNRFNLEGKMSPKLTQTLKLNTAQSDVLVNFDKEIQKFVGKPSNPINNNKRSVDLIPVKGSSFSVIFCVVSARIPAERVARYVKECSLFTWPTLSKSICLDYECIMKLKCQQLLKVARKLFCQVATLETVLEIAKEQAKMLLNAEHCSIMLVDIDKMELYDTSAKFKGKSSERRFPFDIGVTGEVINKGTLINIRSPTDHHLFTPAVDCLPGIQCRNFLCFPIREQTGIIGVGQLMNKIDDPYFDSIDEEMALAYSIYCGVCITHSVVYRKIQEAHIRNVLANELVMYHMKVTDKEVDKVLKCPLHHDPLLLDCIQFNRSQLASSELPCYVFQMFVDLGYDTMYKISHAKLCRFIVSVKKEYRPVPYHNWLHAFSVTQWAYAALVNYNLVSQGYFSDLQAFTYLLAGLMHDMGHSGSSLNFKFSVRTTLVALYSSEGSVLERHRLSQAICILNTEGCDILEAMPRRDYDMALMLLKDFILATDLSNFSKNLRNYEAIAKNYQKTKTSHKLALQCLMMNAADLNDYLKDWNFVKRTAADVLTELFKQTDIGKKSKKSTTYNLLDSEKKSVIPDLQIAFMRSVCVPLFTILEQILPQAQNCVSVLESHIISWENAKLVFAEVPVTEGLTVLLSPNLDSLIEQKVAIRERKREEELARLAAEEEED